MNEQYRPEDREDPDAEAEARKEGNDYVFNLRVPRMPRLLPEETRTHMRNAQREMLMAFRSLLDRAIHNLERTDDDETGGSTRIEIR